MSIRTVATTAAVVLGLAATAATPSFAAPRHHADQARQYESLVQRDARVAGAQQVQQQHTFSVWGSNFSY